MKQVLILIPITQKSHLDLALNHLEKAIKKGGGKVRTLTLVTNEKKQEFGNCFEDERLSNYSIPLDKEFIEGLIGQGKKDKLFEFFVGSLRCQAEKEEIVLIRGIEMFTDIESSFAFNKEIALSLSAQTVFVGSCREKPLESLKTTVCEAHQAYKHQSADSLSGIIFTDRQVLQKTELENWIHEVALSILPVLGVIPGGSIDQKWVESLLQSKQAILLSPAIFRYDLIQKAKEVKKKILLPEGEDSRIIQAAIICNQRGVASCSLIGKPEKVAKVAKESGIEIQGLIDVIDPDLVSEDYVIPLTELRKNKGMTEESARETLKDQIYLGTMLLHMGEFDGLVAGASTPTAKTISPAFKIIKTAPSSKLVSSLFFMCLPDQVLVYSDCAVNVDPSFEELAEIAIQSADSAKRLGIVPRVAMISYSTGKSGKGEGVIKVEKATELARQKRPDLMIDGPLQYDAAASLEVARKKAPKSVVAGQATVYIFPDLNTANTTYKAVQRSAHILAIGPMLQGLNKPFNDLSRGASVEDIIYTIAITAIQSK